MKTKSIPDQYGNYFEVEENKGWLSVSIKLEKEIRLREIGKGNLKERFIEIKRNKVKHLFRKNNSYGFNEHLIKTGNAYGLANWGNLTHQSRLELLMFNNR